MDAEDSVITVSVIAFGQSGEQLGGRHHEQTVQPRPHRPGTCFNLGLEEWIAFGLSVALNGERCGMDTLVNEGGEIALLPPSAVVNLHGDTVRGKASTTGSASAS